MRIDLNSDVGDSFGSWTMGDDAAILRSVSSADVACGFHAGDPSGIARTCREAVAAGVVIGAHVGDRDLAGFGRRFVDCSPTELADDVLYQLGALEALARAAGGGGAGGPASAGPDADDDGAVLSPVTGSLAAWAAEDGATVKAPAAGVLRREALAPGAGVARGQRLARTES